MILRRITESLRAQNWTAIAIEFVIVVIGVFLGTQVANWNQERLERRATQQMLEQLVPELRSQLEFYDNVKTYFGTGRVYADRALKVWNGDTRTSDADFVIAAYQASQITGIGTNSENWTLTFGGDQMRDISDPAVRRNLEVLLTADYSIVSLEAVSSPYRENVRRVIPIHIQDDIRRLCGDRNLIGKFGVVLVTLPPTCDLSIPPADAKRIAARLRARPDLVEELNWHLAAIAVLLENAKILEQPIRALLRDLSAAD